MHNLRDCTGVIRPCEWSNLYVMIYPIPHKFYNSKCLQNEDSMNIEKYMIQFPSINRAAFCGRLSLCVYHNNAMIPTSLNDRFRFNGIQTREMYPFPVNIVSFCGCDISILPALSPVAQTTVTGKVGFICFFHLSVVCILKHICTHHIFLS